jgi:hypothetical protein
MAPEFDVDYFLAKCAAIPKEKFVTDRFVNDRGAIDVFAHCGETRRRETAEGRALSALFRKHGLGVMGVEHGYHASFKQAHPQTRILAALRMIKQKDLNKSEES